jgi:hypothetical protein
VNYWTGEEGRQFELEFASYVGCRRALAVANGTVALELALWACGIDGGEVVVPARTFVATASAARMRGAVPVFADVDRDSGCLTAETVEAVITPRTRAVIAVHIAGWPCEIDELVSLCRARGVVLIEDCAQAHGATYKGREVGSFGDAAAFSFCQDKIMTTAGEGGMLVTDDEELWRRAWSIKDHGKNWARTQHADHAPGFRWLHDGLGTNWRLSEVQSAVGRVQLRKLDRWLAYRRELARRFDDRFAAVQGLRVPAVPEHSRHARYRYYVYVQPEALASGWSRDRILNAAIDAGLQVSVGSCSEIYLEDAFPASMKPQHPAAVARELGATSLALLVDPTITEDEVERTCEELAAIMRDAIR